MVFEKQVRKSRGGNLLWRAMEKQSGFQCKYQETWYTEGRTLAILENGYDDLSGGYSFPDLESWPQSEE